MSAAVRLNYHPDHLRPGGTISGPSMFALCDLALYVAILHEIGRVKLAVTTNVSINFLRRPEPKDLIGRARLMKLGKRLAVGEVALFSPGDAEMVAHATGTYSIPARGDDEAMIAVVMPANAGIQLPQRAALQGLASASALWMPAFAGMTAEVAVS